MMTIRAYKLVRQRRTGGYRTLFHGVKAYGSTALPMHTWLEAEIKPVRDGSDSTVYQSGWHVLPTRADAESYLARFRKKDDIVIMPCEVRDTWPKAHSPHTVILARYLKLVPCDDNNETA